MCSTSFSPQGETELGLFVCSLYHGLGEGLWCFGNCQLKLLYFFSLAFRRKPVLCATPTRAGVFPSRESWDLGFLSACSVLRWGERIFRAMVTANANCHLYSHWPHLTRCHGCSETDQIEAIPLGKRWGIGYTTHLFPSPGRRSELRSLLLIGWHYDRARVYH